MRRPTLKDIAEKANVSAWTVSNVLNRRGDVSITDATRARVIDIAAKMGYRPNYAARALVSDRTHLIALWTPAKESLSSYHISVSHQMVQVVRRHGYQCITEAVDFHSIDQSSTPGVIGWPMDGIIACDVVGRTQEKAILSLCEGLPLVVIGARSIDAIDWVRPDLSPGARDGLHHLAAVGCRRIAYVGTPLHDARTEAYETVTREIAMPEEYIRCAYQTRASGREALLSYLSDHSMPDGLFCENDDLAIGCFRALCERGIRVPEDVALVGCDGIDDGAFQSRQITTIRIPIQELCEAAFAFLLNRIENPDIPRQLFSLKTDLEIRESSQRLAARVA